MSLNIIIINDFAHVNGGASQVALSSAMALAKHDHTVTFFSAVGPITPELSSHSNLKVFCTNQYEILKDPNRLRAIAQGIWNFKAARSISEILNLCDPQKTIVHIHAWTKALSSSVISKTLKLGFKVVLTLHDYFIACPNGGFFNYPQNKVCRLHPMSLKCMIANCDSRNFLHKLWRVTRKLIQIKLGSIPEGIKHFIVISDFSRAVLEPYLPNNAVIHCIDNPIDVPKKEPVKIHENTALVAVGRLSKEKGSRLLAETSYRLGTKAIFVGDGEDRDLIFRFNPNAEITGWVSHEEVIAYLGKARALVFPSLLFETQGLAVCEAAAMGVPAIVPDTCAAKEMVINGVSGLWFEGGNGDDLADKMTILQDRNIAQRMGLAAYTRHWSNPMTMDNHINQLEKVYNQIL